MTRSAIYAKSTTVTIEKSRAGIEKAVTQYGGTDFGFGSKHGTSLIWFHMQERHVRFILPMPNPNDDWFKFKIYAGKITTILRTKVQRAEAYEQAKRQVWRALRIVVIAKLEAVEAGISEFETEFLGNIMVPGTNNTVAEWLRPQLEQSYLTGTLPPMLPGG